MKKNKNKQPKTYFIATEIDKENRPKLIDIILNSFKKEPYKGLEIDNSNKPDSLGDNETISR
jgi:hypothetical protein